MPALIAAVTHVFNPSGTPCPSSRVVAGVWLFIGILLGGL